MKDAVNKRVRRPAVCTLLFSLCFLSVVAAAWAPALSFRWLHGKQLLTRTHQSSLYTAETTTTDASLNSGNPIPLISTPDKKDQEDSAFDVLAGNVAICLHKSDLKRDSGFDGASTGWSSWADAASALRLQSCLDALEFTPFIKNPQSALNNLAATTMLSDVDWKLQRDEAVRWIRWIKNSPAPVILEFSPELRRAVNATIPNDAFLESIESTREEFLSRIGLRMVVLPSGATLTHNLRAPPGAMVYGKLLMGGVTRFRMIGTSTRKRRAGARTLVTCPSTARTSAWLQYGGPERSYEAIDAGPCAFLELLILPKGLLLPLHLSIDMNDAERAAAQGDTLRDMTFANMKWNPWEMFDLVEDDSQANCAVKVTGSDVIKEAFDSDNNQMGTGKDYFDYLESSFTVTVGGLQTQIDNIIRRVLDGRVLSSSVTGGDDSEHVIRKREMEALIDLGLKPVRGLLLYGPPGCGKTALAREISKALRARPAKIVAASELLDRWVGGSERLVRELFLDAESELANCNGDPTKSALHVIVIDEIDAVFRKRSSAAHDSSGEVTRASAVNQILAKLDGVNELGNVLLIGLTNRRELLDPALLRPGRLEVQIEIPLPDREGRREILNIHFEALRRNGLLSKSLCDAIDGHNRMLEETPGETPFWKLLLRRMAPRDMPHRVRRRRIRDLAADRWTGGFSGADIAGLVRSAGSLALARARKQDGGGIDNLLITLADVAEALVEVKN